MIALLVGARHAGDDLGRMPRRSRPAIAARITRLDRRARARLVEIIERRALERRVEAGLNRERAAGARADMQPKALAAPFEAAQIGQMEMVPPIGRAAGMERMGQYVITSGFARSI